MEVNYKKRYRVNFSQSVKGIITCDTTVELIDGTQDEVIKEAKELLTKAMEIAKEKSLGSSFQVK